MATSRSRNVIVDWMSLQQDGRHFNDCWLGNITYAGWRSGAAVKRSRARLSIGSRLHTDCRQVVHTLAPLSPTSIIWYRSNGWWSTLCGLEGNRRSGIALAVRPGLQLSNHLRTQDLWKGDEQFAYAAMEYGNLYLFNITPTLTLTFCDRSTFRQTCMAVLNVCNA